VEIPGISTSQLAWCTHTGVLQQAGVAFADALDALKVDLVHPARHQLEVDAGLGGEPLPAFWGVAFLEQVVGGSDAHLAKLPGGVLIKTFELRDFYQCSGFPFSIRLNQLKHRDHFR
jgi:hypothetical protein